MKKLLFIAIFTLASTISAQCQVYNYQYQFSITGDGDEIKSPFLNNGVVFKFSFNSDSSMCYLVDDDGNLSDLSKYAYVGVENEMYKYKDASDTTYSIGEEYLYFSEDFSELLWDCPLEKNQKVKSIRYLLKVE